MRSHRYKILSQAIRVLVISAGILALDATVHAASLTVTVSRPGVGNKGSQPIANAQVCVSSNSGAVSSNTNAQGTAVFNNAPQGQLTVTASASGFAGQSIQFTMGTLDKTESFFLLAGSGGPLCTIAPPPPPPVTLSSLVLNPTSVNGGAASLGTVTLSAVATGGASVTLSSNNTSAATVPPSVPVSIGSSSTTFTVSTSQVSSLKTVIITASTGGTTRTATLTVKPPPPPPPATANLTVLVGRVNSTAISGAAVCVASGRGAVRSAVTGVGGQATFNDIPQGQVTITVSSSGFTGQSHTSTLPPGGGTNRFILSEGGGGPVCTAPTPPPATGPPAITFFDWHVNRKTPLFFEFALSFSVTDSSGGPTVPTHYRVGESSDLSSTQWIAYQGGVLSFELRYRGNSLTAYGQRTLHLQVKKDGRTSAVVSKTVNLQPVRTIEVRLEGLDLFGMLTVARDNGFPIRTRTVSVTQSVCDGIDFNLNTRNFGIPSGRMKDRAWEKVVEANLLELSTKRFTPGWRVKSIEIGRSNDTPAQQTITGAPDGDGFRVTIRLTALDSRADPTFCLANSFPLRAIILEGPGDDMALDQAKRWKNMFPPN